MIKKILATVALAGLTFATSCAGVRETDKTFVAHGETFRIFGAAIPDCDMKLALDKVPAGATITNVNASASDWTSFIGVMNNIFGFTFTQIGGTK